MGERPARVRRTLAMRALGLALASGLCGGDAARADDERDVALPAPIREGTVSVEEALSTRRSVREFAPKPLPLASVAQVLWAAQGITHRSGKRTAPSAGALYPLEVHLVAGEVEGLAAGAYRYEPRQHRLEPGPRGDLRAALAKAALGQSWIAEAPAIVVIGAVYERTARKYGPRAPRYVHMEVGHAAQNVYLQAVAMGLGTTMVGALRENPVARLLALPKRTKPLALLPVGVPR